MGLFLVLFTPIRRAGIALLSARLPIPVFRNLFFGSKKMFLTGFLRIFFFLRFPEEFFIGTWFWRGRRNSGFFSDFTGIFHQEFLWAVFLYSSGFRRIPEDSGGFLFPPKTKEGSLLSKIWTKIDFLNLSPEQVLTMVSAAPILCWRLLA